MQQSGFSGVHMVKSVSMMQILNSLIYSFIMKQKEIKSGYLHTLSCKPYPKTTITDKYSGKNTYAVISNSNSYFGMSTHHSFSGLTRTLI